MGAGPWRRRRCSPSDLQDRVRGITSAPHRRIRASTPERPSSRRCSWSAATGGGRGLTVDNAWEIAGTGDFNGDGKDDILWQHSSGSAVIGFMVVTPLPGGVTFYIQSRVVSTGTARRWSCRYSVSAHRRRRFGSADEWNPRDRRGPLCAIDPSSRIVGTADFNADGRADILWRHDSGAAAMWFMNGTQTVGGGASPLR